MEAGDQVRWYAKQRGWPLRQNNILVEGDTDREYFELAHNIYLAENGRSLLCKKLAVFPTGARDDGGTFGIVGEFPTLRKLIDVDLDSSSKAIFRAVCLMDGDSAGKNAANILTSKYTKLKEWQDVFLLHRKLPRSSREPATLKAQVEKANAAWRQSDCEIEDLIGLELLQLFKEHKPNAFEKIQELKDGEFRVKVSWQYKQELLRFCQEHGDASSLSGPIEILRSMRFYLHLDPNGETS